jgi:hypothetical protein
MARIHQLSQFPTATPEQHTRVLRWRIDFTDAAGHFSGSHSPEQAKIAQATSFAWFRQRPKAIPDGEQRR